MRILELFLFGEHWRANGEVPSHSLQEIILGLIAIAVLVTAIILIYNGISKLLNSDHKIVRYLGNIITAIIIIGIFALIITVAVNLIKIMWEESPGFFVFCLCAICLFLLAISISEIHENKDRWKENYIRKRTEKKLKKVLKKEADIVQERIRLQKKLGIYKDWRTPVIKALDEVLIKNKGMIDGKPFTGEEFNKVVDKYRVKDI